MKHCWHADMDKRPSLEAIKQDLKSVICEYAKYHKSSGTGKRSVELICASDVS